MPTPEDLTIPDKLDSLKATKQAIRQAIEAKGVTVPTDATFYEYSDSIAEISTGTPLPEGGTAGQVLTKTADGIAWQDAIRASDIQYGVVTFASNEDFCAYMGIEYNASDWT